MTDQTTRGPAQQTGPVTVARLREWVLGAKPGARLTYARGHAASAGIALRDEVQRLGHRGLGLISEHYVRRPGWSEGENIVQRTAKPLLKGQKL